MLKENEISVSTNEIKVGGRVLPKFSAFYIPKENRWACFQNDQEEPYTFLVDKDSVLVEIKNKYPSARLLRS